MYFVQHTEAWDQTKKKSLQPNLEDAHFTDLGVEADLRLLLPLFCCCFNTPLTKNLFRPYQSAGIAYMSSYTHLCIHTCIESHEHLPYFPTFYKLNKKIPKTTKSLRILHTEPDISGWYHAVGAWLKATWSPFQLQPTCCSPIVPCWVYTSPMFCSHISYKSYTIYII